MDKLINLNDGDHVSTIEPLISTEDAEEAANAELAEKEAQTKALNAK